MREDFNNILLQFEAKDDTIKRLQEEIKHLKSENYKDEELAKMQEQLTKMKKDYYRGFPISEEEMKKVSEWQTKHEAEKHFRPEMAPPRGGAIGGCYTYYFTPTSIGVFGAVKCSCGEEFTFQEEA